MTVLIANRKAEILFQTADVETFRVRFENGVEANVSVMDFEFVPDVFLVEKFMPNGDINCNVVAL